MNSNMKFWRRALSLLAIVAVTIGSIAAGPGPSAHAAQNSNPNVLPPNSTPYGRTYGQWNDAWVQWIMGIPVDFDHPELYPLLDTTGAACGAGQSGPVWFLAGNFGGITIRNCTTPVPAGKSLFFPILNGWCDSSPAPHDTYEHLQACAKPGIDAAANLSADIDGRTITNLQDYRAFTPPPNPFVDTLPDNNLWQYFGCTECIAGDYDAYADGYYLMLAPLSAGQHTIHFHGEIPDFGFTVDVTYNLTVSP